MSQETIHFETLHNISSPDDLGVLAAAITTCITSSFGQEMPQDEVSSALSGDLIVLAKNDDESVIGFVSLHRKTVGNFEHPGLEEYSKDTMLFYLGSGVIDEDYQGHGIYRELNRKRLSQVVVEKSPLLTTTTQNPKVEKGITAVLNEFAEEGLIKSFSITRTILPNFYGRRLTKNSLTTVGSPFEELNIEAGDCFSLIFQLNY